MPDPAILPRICVDKWLDKAHNKYVAQTAANILTRGDTMGDYKLCTECMLEIGGDIKAGAVIRVVHTDYCEVCVMREIEGDDTVEST